MTVLSCNFVRAKKSITFVPRYYPERHKETESRKDQLARVKCVFYSHAQIKYLLESKDKCDFQKKSMRCKFARLKFALCRSNKYCLFDADELALAVFPTRACMIGASSSPAVHINCTCTHPVPSAQGGGPHAPRTTHSGAARNIPCRFHPHPSPCPTQPHSGAYPSGSAREPLALGLLASHVEFPAFQSQECREALSSTATSRQPAARLASLTPSIGFHQLRHFHLPREQPWLQLF